MKYSISKNSRSSRYTPITNRLPVLLLCLLVFAFLGKAAWNAYVEQMESVEALKNTEEKLSKLKERDAFIKEELESLPTEEGREAKLREKFGVGRPGEQIAIIVEADAVEDGISSENDIWPKVKDFFKSLFER